MKESHLFAVSIVAVIGSVVDIAPARSQLVFSGAVLAIAIIGVCACARRLLGGSRAGLLVVALAVFLIAGVLSTQTGLDVLRYARQL